MSRFPSRPANIFHTRDFWRTHLVLPAAIMILCFAALEVFGLDRPIAHTFFYSAPTHRWLGAGAGDAWAHRLIHDGGRWLPRSVGAGAFFVWLVSFMFAGARRWRRTAGFVFLAIAVPVGLVGALKLVTNVDCPWDLAEFGGDRPYVALFEPRPEALPQAQCFPGAHASSGFALVCLYFALRDRSRHAARWALLGACLVGIVFSIGQEARGAHFLSHDLAAAGIVWIVQLALYARLLEPRTGRASAAGAPRSGSRRSFLFALVAEKPEHRTHHDQGDADTVPDAGSPIVNPAQQDELHVDEAQHERSDAEQHHQTTETLHVSPS
jgi:membrane-associated PAP2 superfamily phosphatase